MADRPTDWLTSYLTNYVDLTSWEGTNASAGQLSAEILWNSEGLLPCWAGWIQSTPSFPYLSFQNYLFPSVQPVSSLIWSSQWLRDWRKSIAFWKVHWLCPFVLVRATCIWRWVRSIGGVMLTGEAEVLGEKHVPGLLCPPQISHWLTWDRAGPSAMRGRRLTAWDTSLPPKTKINLNNINILSVPRCKHSPSLL
jgi:hypothetical protein